MEHQGTQTSVNKTPRNANMHLGMLTSTNITPKRTNEHQPNASSKKPNENQHSTTRSPDEH